MRYTITALFVPIAALLITACAVGPDYRSPDIDTGAGWTRQSVGTETEVDLNRWWNSFDDPILDRLIARGLEQNFDVRQAIARVAEARALREAATGQRFPSLDASASVTRRRQSENGPIPINAIPGLDRDQTIYEPGFDALWELDLFGRTRRAVEASDARLAAAVEYHRAARMTVAAEIARGYFELRGAQNELVAREAAVSATRESVALVQLQFEAGQVPESALVQARAELAAVEVDVPLLEARARTAALAIGTMLGALPESELELIDDVSGFAALAAFPVGERGDLLLRRPDVRAAERTLAAATADVGVATADLFPRISIGGAGSFQSLDSGNLFESASEAWSVMPLISWRAFDGGRTRARVRATEARVEAAALAYEQAVKRALADAEAALVRYEFGLRALDRWEAALEAARTSYRYATESFRAGEISLLELLDAERSLRNAEDGYAKGHTQTAKSLVSLFKALGGGWQEPDSA
jgi:NodT family efflux transporter outer membrane factor (OMF) lipoprotein